MKSVPRLATALCVAAALLYVGPVAHPVLAADTPAGVPSTWVRKAPGGWVYWVPTKKWTDKHSKCGIDISSPTGTMLVGIGAGPLPVPMDTQQAFAAIVDAYENDEGLSNVSVIKEYPVVDSPGEQTQSFLVRGQRTLPGKPSVAVTAMISVGVLSVAGGYGIEASVVLAPTKDFKKEAKTLGIILKNVVSLETDCVSSAS